MPTSLYNRRIHVNVKSNYYKYPNFPAHPNCLPSIYSREKPYIIDNQALESFWTNNPNSVNYQPPLSGPYTNSVYTITPCCNNFLKEANQENEDINKENKEIVIYPNPTTQDFTIRFIPTILVAKKFLTFLGKVVFERTEPISEKINPVSIHIQLPNSLPLGQYILRTTLNDQLFSNKLILQQ
ncbi:MAG: T9SS type A sorting domain-containing protein [Bacteroidetes bacterium]|nr:T9SS type A sorting domain-containing protein [Bacteroidota bacterium]